MVEKGAEVGAYRVEETIGRGGMGAVYRGVHSLLGRPVAIKVLLAQHAHSEEIVARFFNEARALTKLADPGLVQVFDFGHHTDGSAYLVMELLSGESVARRLGRVGRFGPLETVRLVRLMCASMAVAHAAGIIHRDLKPENVFLVADVAVPGGERPKILDFGIAKITFDEQGPHRTRTNALIGTPTFMSPEQCRGGREIDARSDIYSLGCVMFVMLTGRPPFERELPGDLFIAHIQEPPPRLSSLVPELTGQLEALVERCLQKRPADRFASMEALGQELSLLERELAGEPFIRPARPSTLAPPPAIEGETVCLRAGDSALARREVTTLNSAIGQVRDPRATRPKGALRRVAMGGAILVLAAGSVLLGATIFGRPASDRRQAVPAKAAVPKASSDVPRHKPSVRREPVAPSVSSTTTVDAPAATVPSESPVSAPPAPPMPPAPSAERALDGSAAGAPATAGVPAKPKRGKKRVRSDEPVFDENGIPIHR